MKKLTRLSQLARSIKCDTCGNDKMFMGLEQFVRCNATRGKLAQ